MKSWLIIWISALAYTLGASWAVDTFWKDDLRMKFIVFAPVAILFSTALFEDQIWAIRNQIARSRALKSAPDPTEEAVLVYLRANGLPKDIYEQYDVMTLEDQLRGAIKENKLGEFDGNESGPEETVLFMYGPDAEKLFKGIESVLRAYPLCKNGSATIRYGPPGSARREVSLS